MPVAFYQVDDQYVQVQALGHGAWLSRAKSGRLSWGAEPASFIRHEKDGIITLQGYGYDEGGEILVSYQACAEGGYSLLYPTWQKLPTAVPVLSMRALERAYSLATYQGPYPAPDVLRGGTEYPGLDFGDVVLRGIDLTGSNLPGANFTKATLRSVAFTKANLPKAQFQGNVLYWEGEQVQCIFNNANLRRANLNRVVANSCRFDWADMQQASLVGARLPWSDLGGANLTDADCTEADLTGVVMLQAVITKAVFRRGTLAQVHFTHTTVGENDFTEANLQHTQFQGRVFCEKPAWERKGAARSLFTRADLSWAQFDNAKVADCDFARALLQEASFKGALLDFANFTEANLSKTDFFNASLVYAHLDNAVLSDTNFTKSNMRLVYFSGAKFDNTTFAEADFEKVDFRKFVFWREGEQRPSNFHKANLVEANFE